MPRDLLADSQPRDLLATKEPTDLIPNEMGMARRVGSDALIGLAQMGHGLLNTPSNLADALAAHHLISSGAAHVIPRQREYDFGSMVGVKDPTTLDKIIQGAAQYSPAMLMGGTTILGQMAAGSAFGATQSKDPLMGAAAGAGGGLVGGVGGKALGAVGEELPGLAKSLAEFLKETVQRKSTEDLANPLVNSLARQLGNPSTINKDASNEVIRAFKQEKLVSKDHFSPINNSDLRLDDLSENIDNPYKNYANAATKLLAQRENLTNLFGTGTDLGAKLNSELTKASSFLKGKEKWGVTFKEAAERVKTLGKLSATATSMGNRNEARLLIGLKTAMKDDVKNLLVKSGHKELATNWQTAIDHYRDHIMPFYKNRIINKIVTTGEKPVGMSLAKTLHDPANSVVMRKVGQPTKDALFSRLLTRGKTEATGITNQQPHEIASNWKNLDTDYKAQVKTHNPETASFFDELSKHLEQPEGAVKRGYKLAEDKLTSMLAKRSGTKPSGITSEAVDKYIPKGRKPFAHKFLSRAIESVLIPKLINEGNK